MPAAPQILLLAAAVSFGLALIEEDPEESGVRAFIEPLVIVRRRSLLLPVPALDRCGGWGNRLATIACAASWPVWYARLTA